MIKNINKTVLSIVAVSLVFLIYAIRPSIFAGNNPEAAQISVSSELKGISRAEVETIKKEVRTALNSIPRILGVEQRKSTEIKIVETGICYASGGVVSLSIMHIRDNSAPIIHEVTHVFSNHKYNSFFSEGLAVYFQERFGLTSGFPNFSVPLDEAVRNHKHELVHISRLMNDNGIFQQTGTERRRIAYIAAGSFINFLVEKYGEQKLADLHNSKNLDYKIVYGKQPVELEKEWEKYIFGAHLTKA